MSDTDRGMERGENEGKISRDVGQSPLSFALHDKVAIHKDQGSGEQQGSRSNQSSDDSANQGHLRTMDQGYLQASPTNEEGSNSDRGGGSGTGGRGCGDFNSSDGNGRSSVSRNEGNLDLSSGGKDKSERRGSWEGGCSGGRGGSSARDSITAVRGMANQQHGLPVNAEGNAAQAAKRPHGDMNGDMSQEGLCTNKDGGGSNNQGSSEGDNSDQAQQQQRSRPAKRASLLPTPAGPQAAGLGMLAHQKKQSSEGSGADRVMNDSGSSQAQGAQSARGGQQGKRVNGPKGPGQCQLKGLNSAPAPSSNEANQQTMGGGGGSVGRCKESAREGSQSRKSRVVWTSDLHARFMNAVHMLGIDKSTPKEILNLMQVDGMTRENVSSHFQKYKSYLKRLVGVAESDTLAPSLLHEAHEKAIMHHNSQQMMAAQQHQMAAYQQQQQQMFMGQWQMQMQGMYGHNQPYQQQQIGLVGQGMMPMMQQMGQMGQWPYQPYHA